MFSKKIIWYSLSLSFLFIFQPGFAQQNIENSLTGNLSYDANVISKNYTAQKINILTPSDDRKSPFLAGLMSLVVPGAGEVYSGSYLRAGVFLALEASLITLAVIYDKKGDKQTDNFEKYADENYSVVKYAEWLNTYKDANIEINPNTNLPSWERVNWAQLNAAEASFSHKLPSHGEQQYYELIGKYPQFSPGWRDFNSADYHDVAEQTLMYDGMRGDANDLYNVAAKAVIGIYVNHFLSGLDAVWSTVSYNKDLSVKMRVEKLDFADHSELIPTLKMSYSF